MNEWLIFAGVIALCALSAFIVIRGFAYESLKAIDEGGKPNWFKASASVVLAFAVLFGAFVLNNAPRAIAENAAIEKSKAACLSVEGRQWIYTGNHTWQCK